jgi:acyl dehydratase
MQRYQAKIALKGEPRVPLKYLEDFVVGESEIAGSHTLTEPEIIAYGQAWDPIPIHVDPGAPESAAFGGVIAAGTHLIAATVRALVRHPPRPAIIAGLGLEQVRYLGPGRAGDTLQVRRTCLEARPSRGHPDRGVVRNRIEAVNQRGEVVLSYVDALLVRRRAKPAKGSSAERRM